MNEEMKNALNSFVERMLETMEAGVDFASEQIPILLHEILYWGFAISAIQSAIGIVLVIAGYTLFKKAFGYHKDLKNQVESEFETSEKTLEEFVSERKRNNFSNAFWKVEYKSKYHPDGPCYQIVSKGDGFGAFVSFVIPTIMSLVGVLITVFNWTWLQILLAPRLYLLEYAADLTR